MQWHTRCAHTDAWRYDWRETLPLGLENVATIVTAFATAIVTAVATAITNAVISGAADVAVAAGVATAAATAVAAADARVACAHAFGTGGCDGGLSRIRCRCSRGRRRWCCRRCLLCCQHRRTSLSAARAGGWFATDSAVPARIVVTHLAHTTEIHVALGFEGAAIGTRSEESLDLSALRRTVCGPARVGATATIPQPSACFLGTHGATAAAADAAAAGVVAAFGRAARGDPNMATARGDPNMAAAYRNKFLADLLANKTQTRQSCSPPSVKNCLFERDPPKILHALKLNPQVSTSHFLPNPNSLRL